MSLLIVDGYGFVFRAYHSLPPLTSNDGTPVGAVYGFVNMLLKLLDNHKDDKITIALDSGQKNFRHEIYADYKANRPPAPDDLVVQFPIIKEAIEALDLFPLVQNNLEADDLIAAYAINAADKDEEVTIVSSDKDLMQLINNKVKMFDPMKNKIIDENAVIEKFGIKPTQVSDYLSLLGDSSDNVPGVKGIGAKSASELLLKYDSMDKIYENIDEITTPRRQNLLKEGKELAYLSKDLVNLHKDYDLDINLEKLVYNGYNSEKLQQFLTKYGFKKLLKTTGNTNSTPTTKKAVKFNGINDIKELNNIKETIYKNGILSLYYNDEFLYLTSDDINHKVLLSQQTQQDFFSDNQQNLSIESVFSSLKDILESSSVNKVIFEAKPVYKKLKEINIHLNSFDDIQMMAYSLDTGKYKYSFEDLCQNYLDNELEINSSNIIRIYQQLRQNFLKQQAFYIYYNIDKPLLPIIAEMEHIGTKVSPEILNQLSQEFQTHIDSLEQEIYKLAGKEFNIASPKQLGETLFVDLDMPEGKKSKTGNFSTGSEILEKLSSQGFQIADKILSWRHYNKLTSTYTKALVKAINADTKRVHTTFSLVSTNTGRFSSNNPNLQNIPIRTNDGQKIRTAFICEAENIILAADYSQIELRLLAHLAKIDSLQNAFNNNEDIHTATARDIFLVTEVDDNLRRKAKMINFGIIYGISAFGLAQRLGISNKEAKEYIQHYLTKYPGIQAYMDDCIAYTKTHGYIKTIFGRKCYINGINSNNFSARNFAQRAAINAPLQGSNADIIKKAMLALPPQIREHLILQVHDELVFEIPKIKIEEYRPIIKQVMENICEIRLKVDIKHGNNWAEAH